jgi:hypothetical protein
LKPCGTCEDKRQKTKDKSAEKKSLVFMTERLYGTTAHGRKGEWLEGFAALNRWSG